MSGQWPPEWEDPDDGHSDAGLPDAGHSDLDLAEVTAFLASVHSPALPPSFEARIRAAIAAEAAVRSANATEFAGPPVTAAGADDAKATIRSDNLEEFSVAAASGSAAAANRRPRRAARTSRSTASSSGPGGSRPDNRRRRLRIPSAEASGWLLVGCLVIAGFGYLFAHASSSSSSSAASSGTSAQGAAPAASAAAGSAREPSSAGLGPQNANDEPTASSSAATGFVVNQTDTRYQGSTLASQVQGQFITFGLGTHGSVTPGSTAAAASSATASTPASASAASSAITTAHTPSPRLEGCVQQVTGGVTPSFVDRASYDGKPAYIIAVPAEVWVVGLGCSATDTDVIAHVPLTG